jgi:hypothetical protein
MEQRLFLLPGKNTYKKQVLHSPEHSCVVEDALSLYTHDVIHHVERARLKAQSAGHKRARALMWYNRCIGMKRGTQIEDDQESEKRRQRKKRRKRRCRKKAEMRVTYSSAHVSIAHVLIISTAHNIHETHT